MVASAEQDAWVLHVLGVAIPSSGPNGAAHGGDLSKLLAVWEATSKQVAAQVERLKSSIVSMYAERGLGPALARAYQDEVQDVLGELDDELSRALKAAVANTDERRRPSLIAGARAAIDDYASFVGSNAVMKALEANPFEDLTLGKTLSATLTVLSKAVH